MKEPRTVQNSGKSYGFTEQKLISSKKYGRTLSNQTDENYRWLRSAYDDFLDQKLTLGMFIPCDENGAVLDEPEKWDYFINKTPYTMLNRDIEECKQYQQAKERVLFEGFEYKPENEQYSAHIAYKGKFFMYCNNFNDTVEELIQLQPTLTPTARKQIGLD